MSNDRLVIREPRLDLGANREVPRDFTGEQAYDWLAIHHPKTNAEAVRTNNPAAVDRPAAHIDGELEAVRTRGDRNGIPLVMKDLIFETTTGNKSVMIPNPVQGYVELRNDGTNAISIWSKPLGSPDNELVGQVLHGARGSSPYKQGDFVPYGAPLVRQSDVGSPGAVHAHIEVEPAQFKRYLGDILSERINTRQYPATNGQTDPARPENLLADGKLSHGEYGPDVEKLQRALNAAGARDAKGNPLNPDKDFGDRTREAVQDYQRKQRQPVTGVADRQMLIALGVIAPTQQQGPTDQRPVEQRPAEQRPPEQRPVEQQRPAAQTNPYGYGPDNPLGRLIGSGEGGYNSFNRGVAGDARGAQIDFSQMTVGEIMRRQDLPRSNSDRLFAVGKYQFTPDTLEETVRTLGIDRNAKFTPQLQEKMFADYLIDEKRPAVKAYVIGKTGGAAGLDNAQHALAQEFASVGTPRKGGRGVYDGDSGGNLASISPAQTERVLNQMREQYQKNVQAGMNPDEAYRALSGDPNKYSRDSGAVGQGQSQQNPGRGGGLDDTLLVKDERGEGVLRLQRALNDAGIRDDQGRKLPETGNFLDLTEAAVRKYQEQQKLDVDGKAGRDTLTALGIYPGQQQTPPAQQNPPQQQPPAQQPPAQQTTAGNNWPAPGNFTVNRADKAGEGEGEFGTPRSGGREHKGIDINGRVGDPIESFGPGKVIYSGTMSGYGNTVVIQHDNGLQTLYAHMDSRSVDVGDRVTENTRVGTMGRTGNTPSAGDTHLHFEIRENANGVVLGGQAVDPRKYLEFPPRTLLEHGDQGPDVRKLQESLNRAFVDDPKWEPLPTTGYFGDKTEAAVRRFQEQQKLEVDGRAGRDTLTALGIYPGQQQSQSPARTESPTQQTAPAQQTSPAQQQAPQLSNPTHPDHALYQQAMTGLERLPPGAFPNAQARENAAATLAFEAKVSGMGRIDQVVPAGNNAGFFAVQGGLDDPANRRVYVDRDQAMNQSVQQSTQLLQSTSAPTQQLMQDAPRQDAPSRSAVSL